MSYEFIWKNEFCYLTTETLFYVMNPLEDDFSMKKVYKVKLSVNYYLILDIGDEHVSWYVANQVPLLKALLNPKNDNRYWMMLVWMCLLY